MFFVWTLVLHSPFINYDWLRNELFMRSTNQMQNINLFNLPCFSALKQFAFFRHEFSVAHHDYFSLWFVALIKCSFTINIQKALQNDCSLVFYRAFARLRVFTLSSLVMFTFHLIGWCKYFEFGFAALIENALCRVFSLYSWVVGYSHKKSSYTTRMIIVLAPYMLQLPREGRVIDEVKVRLGTFIIYRWGGGGGQWGFFWEGTWFLEGKDGNQSSPTG